MSGFIRDVGAQTRAVGVGSAYLIPQQCSNLEIRMQFVQDFVSVTSNP